MRVLLIEDDGGFRTALARALMRRGCEVLEAQGEHAALGLAQSGGIQAVVLDLRLGNTDGAKLIPELRRLIPEARLLVLTGYGSIPGALKAIRLGADDYLLKPASADQVLTSIKGLSQSSNHPTVANLPSLARLEWEHIQRVLHECGGNISHAAAALGIDRRTLQRKLGKLPPMT